MNLSRREIDAISNVGLAHLGDGVYELMCRSYLCAGGDRTIKTLHRDSVALVTASTQARLAEKLLPHLSPEEQAYYRRGKNAHTHAAPKSATPREYAMATGLETLFGALYLAGKTDRLNELFSIMMKEADVKPAAEAENGI
ncbi:MAG: ribonuclease III domain-containing protein [Firmicutes bacterium]|nr:ribonuclease III domain-containing protein [Bacillota bacterium]